MTPPASASRICSPPSFADKAEAYRAEDEAVKPAQARSLLTLSADLSAKGRQEESLRAARLARALDPTSAAVLNDAAVAEMTAGDLAGAIAGIRLAQAVSGEAVVHANAGYALLAAGAHSQAAEEFEHVVALDNLASGAHLLIGLCLLETGRTGDAEAAFDRACRDDPAFRGLLAPQTRTWRAAGRSGRGAILAAAVGRVRAKGGGNGALLGLEPRRLMNWDPGAIETRGWTAADAQAQASGDAGASNGRIAFALHDHELVNHYSHIWRQLDPASFDLVSAAPGAIDNTRIAAFGASLGYRVRFVGDVLAEGDRYEVVVSNHFGAAGVNNSGEPIVLRLGARHVRMMYALGKAKWNFADWNEAYDLILCWGPYQFSGLSGRAHPKLVQIGYPRFDPFFWPMEERAEAVRRLGADPNRPTVVWLPTWGDLSSIDAWAKTVGSLRDQFNVLVKVHPLTPSEEKHRMSLLADAGIAPIADPTMNNIELFTAADFVLADYGGSPFGAVYADRELVLLDVPGAAEHALTGSDSLDVTMRRWLTHIDPGEATRLPVYLADSSARQDQSHVREGLRRSLFAPFEGIASDVAAAVLANALGEQRMARHSTDSSGRAAR